jgi:hypothetical protein
MDDSLRVSWPFADPPNVITITTVNVLKRNFPTLSPDPHPTNSDRRPRSEPRLS